MLRLTLHYANHLQAVLRSPVIHVLSTDPITELVRLKLLYCLTMLEKNGLKTSIRPAAGENDYETVRSHDGHRLVETVLVKDYDKVCVHLEIAESFDWNMANAVEVQLTLISTKPLRSEVIKMPPTQKQISLDLETFKIWDPATKYWKDASFQFVPIQVRSSFRACDLTLTRD